MRGHLAMRNAIRDDFNGEAFRIADGVLARGSVTHHTRDFEGLSDPAAIVFALEGAWPFAPRIWIAWLVKLAVICHHFQVLPVSSHWRVGLRCLCAPLSLTASERTSTAGFPQVSQVSLCLRLRLLPTSPPQSFRTRSVVIVDRP